MKEISCNGAYNFCIFSRFSPTYFSAIVSLTRKSNYIPIQKPYISSCRPSRQVREYLTSLFIVDIFKNSLLS